MWVFLNDAFLSAVQHRDEPDNLMIRARRREDLERVFGADAAIVESKAADYRWRITVPKGAFANVLRLQVAAIDYDNFKSSVEEVDRHDAYMAVWQAMYRFQQR
jgi:hypothetical protein